MKEVHLISVGKIKDKNIDILEADYLKRLKNPLLKLHEVKSHAENLTLEGDEVLKRIDDICKGGSAYVILLAENGKIYDSPQFSKWYYDLIENRSETIVLVIGGASGHGPKVIERANAKLSLSPLTFPHKMARLILIEQLYRAQTIYQGHPYHK
ncbi:putative rRNA large subunit m3Psi methyltransferase RlmH [Bacteriovorax sp. BSW11_IV]|uniref:23S rRNA (pseudouridine(1915)-N(3))-methyltransferase RlmH n=1 Tax=Bacteriovorax sp. BSW11_IV TaxID=1353529 RepID=UPI000389E8F3|nr:23S rRNA (pseudouridine(1915)-N(3))-methyltransferase RlmH [Bacteriovorax sp. BSW11_IV]EQC45936.1 putative rRNA large subunit m3Psi methyltransferase RlmH [Bacteriovorax sp. BSW11_IV]